MSIKAYESGGFIWANGQLLAEVTKAEVMDKGNLNPVYTTLLGYAGAANGPIEAQMTIESAMPKRGAELAWANALNSRQVLIIRLKSEGISESYEMQLNDSTRTFQPSAAATKNLSLIGKKLGAPSS